MKPPSSIPSSKDVHIFGIPLYNHDGCLLHLSIRQGWLAGAVLDVFEKEPLPTDSRLWSMPEVWLTLGQFVNTTTTSIVTAGGGDSTLCCCDSSRRGKVPPHTARKECCCDQGFVVLFARMKS